MTDRPITILNVDDDDAKRYVVSRILRREGFTVAEAAGGEEALRLVATLRPDLIVLDVNMPGLDGFEVCRRLKNDPSTSSIPVLHLSATFVDSENRTRGLEGGADSYLTQDVEPAELVATVRALLRMREAEERALLLSRQWQATFDALNDGVCLLDLDGGVVRANRALAVLLDRPADATVTYQDLMRVLGCAADDPLNTLRANRERRVLECAAGQHWFRVTVDGVWQPDGTLAGAVCLVSDVSDHKRGEEARRQLLDREREWSARMQQLAQISLRLNAAHDVDSVLRLLTEEARHLIGARQAAARFEPGGGTAAAQAVVPSEPAGGWPSGPQEADLYAALWRQNRPLRRSRAELEAGPAGGQGGPLPNGLLVVPLGGRDGRNLGWIRLADKEAGDFSGDDEAVLVQLAQMAAVALENARLVEELRDRDRQKDEFLAMLAHELRNPLAPIRNATQVFRLLASDSPDQGAAIDLVERQVQQMTRLIDDLMDVSRVTRGKVVLQREPVDVTQIVRRAVETARPTIDARRHTLTIALPEEPVWVDGDLIRLAQVMANLLHNAAKYTEEGGRIDVQVAVEGPEVILRVRDTGIGVAPEILPHVFDLFTQADRSLDRSQGGLGIGLTLVRRLVEMHGGRVEAHSAGVGRGSEFVVRLPVRAGGGPPEQAEPVPVAEARGLPCRVLVVDDNVDAAESLALLLRLQGHEVRTAHTGPAGLAAAEAFAPDVVLLDIGLPGMNGYEVARRLRTMPHQDGLVLVALTGYGNEEHRSRAETAGFDHHLTKPVEPGALQELLRICPRRGR